MHQFPIVLLLVACAVSAAASDMADHVEGLVAATFTPMYANGSIQVDAVPEQAYWLNKSGVHYAFVSGTTGESVDLTVDERLAMTEAWAVEGPSAGVQVIAHVGAESVRTAQELARHAASTKGVWAFAAMPPTFFRPASVEALVETMASIAAAAPNLPFYYYHIPIKTFVDFPMRDFLRLAEGKIPNLHGIKFTHTDLADLQYCLRYTHQDGSKPNILFGKDEMMLAAVALGVRGAVGTTYNYNGALQNVALNSYLKGDFEKALDAQFDTATLIEAVLDFSSATGTFGFKVLMDMIDEPKVGQARLPFVQAKSDEKNQLLKTTQDWCKSAKVGSPWCPKILAMNDVSN